MFALERFTNKQVSGKGKTYRVTRFIFGFNADSLEDTPQIVRRVETEPIKTLLLWMPAIPRCCPLRSNG